MCAGHENTNKTFIALCEWLVAKGLTKTIILSRLPVGHTHEVEFRFDRLKDTVESIVDDKVCFHVGYRCSLCANLAKNKGN